MNRQNAKPELWFWSNLQFGIDTVIAIQILLVSRSDPEAPRKSSVTQCDKRFYT